MLRAYLSEDLLYYKDVCLKLELRELVSVLKKLLSSVCLDLLSSVYQSNVFTEGLDLFLRGARPPFIPRRGGWRAQKGWREFQGTINGK